MSILSFVTVSNFYLHMEITGNLHHNYYMMYINLMYTIYNVLLCVKYAVCNNWFPPSSNSNR